MKYTLRQPTCTGCPHNLHFGDVFSKKQFGVMMHCGEHYCTGGKRARRFKRSDPKVRVPGWCPKRKNPCELRIYALKSSRDYQMHTLLSADPNDPLYISEHRYALASSARIELTPWEFWKRCQSEPYMELLGVNVPIYSVVEIDDGLAPAFFYRAKDGIEVFRYFDAEKAKGNRMEESV